MRKRMVRGMVVALAGLLVLALGTAHADVSVSIDTAEGATLFSLPKSDLVAYPDGIETRVSGDAGFGSAQGSVLYQFYGSSGTEPIPSYAGQAELSCNESGSECTWSFTVPWILPPGDYEIVVTASEPDPQDPDHELTASSSVDVTVL